MDLNANVVCVWGFVKLLCSGDADADAAAAATASAAMCNHWLNNINKNVLTKNNLSARPTRLPVATL